MAGGETLYPVLPRVENGTVNLISGAGELPGQISSGEAIRAGDEDLCHGVDCDCRSEGEAEGVPAKVRFYHDPAQLFEAGLRLPPELRVWLRRIADQEVDLCRPIEARIYAHDRLAGLRLHRRLCFRLP